MSSVFFYEPFYDVDRFFDEAFNVFNHLPQAAASRRAVEGTENGAVRALRPRMDLHENKEQNLVTATFELPGLNKEDVHIDVHNGRLTVSGESKISTEHEEKGYAVRERRYGKFFRTLQLPEGVKETEIRAAMENGILTVTFPRTTPEQAPKRITIA
ncbi:hypothetical protein AX16_004921 [Volvariella volvacea WC 439]|nr:hypothetical protein AX16_004921 [Volvariella volvacea WC 439]